MGRCCVIARREAPKQPRGPSARVRVSPLGCFAALAMTRQENKALSPLEGERVGSGGGIDPLTLRNVPHKGGNTAGPFPPE